MYMARLDVTTNHLIHDLSTSFDAALRVCSVSSPVCSLFILFSFQGSVCGVSSMISLVESVVSARQSDAKDNDLLQV